MTRFGRFVRDPLFLVLLVGTAVFALEAAVSGGDDRTVVVSAAQMERFVELWQAQAGRPPNEAELDGVIASHVKEEILAREAERQGLAQDDPIIRRRLVQNLTFLNEDAALVEPPAEAELERYFDDNRRRYHRPASVSFRHVYFAANGADDAAAQAREALAVADWSRWRSLGDTFMLRRTYSHVSRAIVERDFGTDFAAALDELESGAAWQGPLISTHGAHLVLVTAKTAGGDPGFQAVRERVVRDYDLMRRDRANADYYRELLSQYTVVTP